MHPISLQRVYATEVIWLTLVLTVLLPATRALFVVPFSFAHNMWSKERLSSKVGRRCVQLCVKPSIWGRGLVQLGDWGLV